MSSEEGAVARKLDINALMNDLDEKLKLQQAMSAQLETSTSGFRQVISETGSALIAKLEHQLASMRKSLNMVEEDIANHERQTKLAEQEFQTKAIMVAMIEEQLQVAGVRPPSRQLIKPCEHEACKFSHGVLQ